MARRPDPLPCALQGRAFSVRGAGVPRKRLRASDLWAPAHGVRLPAGVDMRAQLAARALRLPPGAALSHATAALMWRLPLPPVHHWNGSVHITTPPGVRARRGKGVTGYQRELPAGDVGAFGEIPATSLTRTFCDLADILCEAELVAVGDVIIGRKGLRRSPNELAAAVERHPRHRTRLRDALALLDDRAESPKESELRVLLVRNGFGGLVTQVEVHEPDGRFVARVDLAIPHLRIAIEYDGDHHRDPRQWRRDQQRRRRLEALGWTYLTVTQADLDDPARLLADLRAAIAARS